MSQSSVSAYFNKRKRAAGEELANVRNKTQRIDSPSSAATYDNVANGKLIASSLNDNVLSKLNGGDIGSLPKIINGPSSAATKRLVDEKRAPSTRLKQCLRPKRSASDDANKTTQPKIVKFIIDESKEKSSECPEPPKDGTIELFSSKDDNADRGMKTPTKEQQIIQVESAKRISARKNLSLETVKAKLIKSSKLQDLKASLDRLKQLEETRQKNVGKTGILKTAETDAEDGHSAVSHGLLQRADRAATILSKGLKKFKSIDLEVLTR